MDNPRFGRQNFEKILNDDERSERKKKLWIIQILKKKWKNV